MTGVRSLAEAMSPTRIVGVERLERYDDQRVGGEHHEIEPQ